MLELNKQRIIKALSILAYIFASGILLSSVHVNNTMSARANVHQTSVGRTRTRYSRIPSASKRRFRRNNRGSLRDVRRRQKRINPFEEALDNFLDKPFTFVFRKSKDIFFTIFDILFVLSCISAVGLFASIEKERLQGFHKRARHVPRFYLVEAFESANKKVKKIFSSEHVILEVLKAQKSAGSQENVGAQVQSMLRALVNPENNAQQADKDETFKITNDPMEKWSFTNDYLRKTNRDQKRNPWRSSHNLYVIALQPENAILWQDFLDSHFNPLERVIINKKFSQESESRTSGTLNKNSMARLVKDIASQLQSPEGLEGDTSRTTKKILPGKGFTISEFMQQCVDDIQKDDKLATMSVNLIRERLRGLQATAAFVYNEANIVGSNDYAKSSSSEALKVAVLKQRKCDPIVPQSPEAAQEPVNRKTINRFESLANLHDNKITEQKAGELLHAGGNIKPLCARIRRERFASRAAQIGGNINDLLFELKKEIAKRGWLPNIPMLSTTEEDESDNGGRDSQVGFVDVLGLSEGWGSLRKVLKKSMSEQDFSQNSANHKALKNGKNNNGFTVLEQIDQVPVLKGKADSLQAKSAFKTLLTAQQYGYDAFGVDDAIGQYGLVERFINGRIAERALFNRNGDNQKQKCIQTRKKVDIEQEKIYQTHAKQKKLLNEEFDKRLERANSQTEVEQVRQEKNQELQKNLQNLLKQERENLSKLDKYPLARANSSIIYELTSAITKTAEIFLGAFNAFASFRNPPVNSVGPANFPIVEDEDKLDIVDNIIGSIASRDINTNEKDFVDCIFSFALQVVPILIVTFIPPLIPSVTPIIVAAASLLGIAIAMRTVKRHSDSKESKLMTGGAIVGVVTGELKNMGTLIGYARAQAVGSAAAQAAAAQAGFQAAARAEAFNKSFLFCLKTALAKTLTCTMLLVLLISFIQVCHFRSSRNSVKGISLEDQVQTGINMFVSWGGLYLVNNNVKKVLNTKGDVLFNHKVAHNNRPISVIHHIYKAVLFVLQLPFLKSLGKAASYKPSGFLFLVFLELQTLLLSAYLYGGFMLCAMPLVSLVYIPVVIIVSSLASTSSGFIFGIILYYCFFLYASLIFSSLQHFDYINRLLILCNTEQVRSNLNTSYSNQLRKMHKVSTLSVLLPNGIGNEHI